MGLGARLRFLGFVAVALVLGACSQGAHPAPRTTNPSTTSSAAAPTSQATSPTAPGTPTCAVHALAIAVLGSRAAAGTIEATFALRNTSTSACALEGYAGAQMLDSSGGPLPTNVVRGGIYSFTSFVPARVTLAPGQSAYFNAGYTDVPSGGQGACPAAASIEVTPPDDFSQLVTAFQAMVCNNGTLTFSPIFGAQSPQTRTTAPPA